MKPVLVAASLLLALAFSAGVGNALNNGLGRTPQMGWNSWGRFACDINEQLIRETIDAVVSTGLAAAGYNYVNMDDCWAGWRDASGFIHPDNKTFPNGVRPLADYAHSKGLLFGLYSDAGEKTCAGRPGSLHYEKNDAATYASWAVDYLKYDNCDNDNISPLQRYPVMRDALNATHRRIFYSLCEWGQDNPATWAAQVGNSWRTTIDVDAQWVNIVNRIDLNDAWWKYAGPGGFNDPDLLQVGNGRLTRVEEIAHFSLWAIAKAPLLITCDVRNLPREIFEILTAPEVIAVNQDPLGAQGHRVWNASFHDATIEVWAGPLANGDIAVLTFNRASVPATIPVSWSALGLTSGTRKVVRDLWARKDLGAYNNGFNTYVEPHGVVFTRLRRP